jgi:hypothetical protein
MPVSRELEWIVMPEGISQQEFGGEMISDRREQMSSAYRQRMAKEVYASYDALLAAVPPRSDEHRALIVTRDKKIAGIWGVDAL